MLFNVIFGILVCYALITPVLMVYCIKFGYKMADNPRDEARKPIIRKPTKPIELTKEQEKEILYMENIMSFDGTGRGQRKIEG